MTLICGHHKIILKMIKIVSEKLSNLRRVWSYSDSQPTEILLASVNIFLTPIASYLELGSLYVFQILLILTGIYQLWCVSNYDLDCRIRAAFVTFVMYFTTLLTYISCIGLPTPSHWGWLVLVFASFSSLRRIKREQLMRQ